MNAEYGGDMDLTPAARVQPDPDHGWAGVDLSDDELVNDEFIASAAARTFAPLAPADEKLFPAAEVTRGA